MPVAVKTESGNVSSKTSGRMRKSCLLDGFTGIISEKCIWG